MVSIKEVFKILPVFALFSLICSRGVAVPEQQDWENHKVFGWNKEAPHSYYIPFPDVESALENDPQQSPYFLLLNGTWKFHWVKKPADRPKDFFKTDFDSSSWNDIKVPGNWEVQGFGIPIYIESGYPFKAVPPQVSHEWNPVGSYRRSFDIPQDWANREIFLHFGAVKSAMYVWINGKEVGYSQGSKTPAEFNITRYIQSGKNNLAVQVYRWSDGSYLEDQDFWRISGIERDVFLYSTPKVYIQDFFVQADLDETYKNGILSVTVDVQNNSGREVSDYRLNLDLFDLEGISVFKKPSRQVIQIGEDSKLSLLYDKKLKKPLKWTAERPNLYLLVISLISDEDEVIEVVSHKIGFRKVEIQDGLLAVPPRSA